MNLAGLRSPKNIEEMTVWFKKERERYTQPCPSHQDGKHKWGTVRFGWLSGLAFWDCNCGAVRTETDEVSAAGGSASLTPDNHPSE